MPQIVRKKSPKKVDVRQQSLVKVSQTLLMAIVLFSALSVAAVFAAAVTGQPTADKNRSVVIDTCRQKPTFKERLVCAIEKFENRRDGDPQPEPLYTVTALQGLPGGYDSCEIYEINENNQSVGRCWTADINYECKPLDTPGSIEINRLCPNMGNKPRAVIWDQTGKVQNLRRPNNELSWGTTGYTLNDLGNAAGFSQTRFSQTAHPMIYVNGRMKVVDPFPQEGHGMMQGMNNHNQIVGWDAYKIIDVPDIDPHTDDKKLIYHSFLWGNDTVTELPSFDDFASSRADDINEAGQIVGSSEIEVSEDNYSWRAVSWSGKDHTFKILDPRERVAEASFPLAINNLPSPQVVGYWQVYQDGPYVSHGFLWQEEKGMVDLGTYGGCMFSFGADINNDGIIVGESYGYPCGENANQVKAILWIFRNDGTLLATDLNNFIDQSTGWHLSYLEGINDQGYIAGWGFYKNQRQPFILKPIQ